MTKRFLIVGNGPTALSAVREIATQGHATHSTLLTHDLHGPAAKALREGGGIVFPEHLIKETRPNLEIDLQSAEWLICANSLTIIPERLLSHFTNHAINMHPGLLPAYAGLHTHQWAIRNGEKEFGATIHFIEKGVDTGDVILQETFPIADSDTGLTLFRKSMRTGTSLLCAAIAHILSGMPLSRTPQDLSCRRLYRHADSLGDQIDWTWSAQRIANFIRAGNYHPLSSPTYTARIHGFGRLAVEILHARPIARNGQPGALLELTPAGPVVGTGDASISLVLDKAILGGVPVTAEYWANLFDQFPAMKNLCVGGTG